MSSYVPTYKSSFEPERSQTRTTRRSLVTSLFLATIPGFIGFGLLIAALVLVAWLERSTIATVANSFQIHSFGLFQTCLYTVVMSPQSISNQCRSREERANNGLPISPLEQATRGLVIIAIIISVPAMLSSIYLGLNRRRREFGSLVSGAIYALAALCGIAGMGCYSGFLVSQVSDAGFNSGGYTSVEASTSFYLGWFGAANLLVSAIMAFASHAI